MSLFGFDHAYTEEAEAEEGRNSKTMMDNSLDASFEQGVSPEKKKKSRRSSHDGAVGRAGVLPTVPSGKELPSPANNLGLGLPEDYNEMHLNNLDASGHVKHDSPLKRLTREKATERRLS